MRKVRIFEHISLDGVIEHDANYTYGGWTAPYRTPAGMALLLEMYGTRFDMLLGRKTYDEFLGYWPNAGDFPMANAINAATKYVVTHRPESLEWGPVGHLGEDIIAGLRDLKSTAGPDLVLCGSISLTSVLLDAGLIDEVILIVYPVLLGKGKRLLSDSFDARKLEFVRTVTTPTGVLLNTYRHLGALNS
ncbi:dihydrofolate reductase family protein [Chitinophaga nivalis]|uniref:Dihydrofolate reductase family protein n=1 Tax=Chitinophaga nivalis TaxID=2991709 RepID=A0ABT3IMK0_9BACT|nr:dihydrofolate reductase family protein [Chitinophaga nivalis]MCW3465131.1 dihydrofolate reductase family protein [Chitinophaga nivalis]MCW3485177.1 dihydrofolate reductase family protein [Chitinophaga nivalis]